MTEVPHHPEQSLVMIFKLPLRSRFVMQKYLKVTDESFLFFSIKNFIVKVEYSRVFEWDKVVQG